MKINESVSEMLRLSHLLFFSRTWRVIDGIVLSMQIVSPWLVFVFVGRCNVSDILSYSWGGSCSLCWLGSWIFPASTTQRAQPLCRFSCHDTAARFLSDLLPTAQSPLLWYLGRDFNLLAFCQEMRAACRTLQGWCFPPSPCFPVDQMADSKYIFWSNSGYIYAQSGGERLENNITLKHRTCRSICFFSGVPERKSINIKNLCEPIQKLCVREWSQCTNLTAPPRASLRWAAEQGLW